MADQCKCGKDAKKLDKKLRKAELAADCARRNRNIWCMVAASKQVNSVRNQ